MSNRHQEVVEDEPQMRSVRLQSTPPMAFPPPPMPGKLSFGSMKPAGLPKKPEPSVSRVAVANLWNVKVLKPLPQVYSLERTHVFVSGASCSEVAQRIAQCLQASSIMAEYDDEEACVEAETSDSIVFSVRLFSSTGKIVVEVQRLDGCCYSFYQTAKMVLRASKGAKKSAGPQRKFTLPSCIPKTSEEDEKKSLVEGLEIASNLLNSESIDSRVMGFQSLDSLSKCTKCDAYVVREILSGPIVSQLVNEVTCFRSSPENGEFRSAIETKNCVIMRRLAISIIANCMGSLESCGKLGCVVEHQENLCVESLCSSLTDDLRSCDVRPHEACEAARCLQQLMRASPEVKSALMRCDAFDAATIAHETGASRHALLEQESQRLRTELSR